MSHFWFASDAKKPLLYLQVLRNNQKNLLFYFFHERTHLNFG